MLWGQSKMGMPLLRFFRRKKRAISGFYGFLPRLHIQQNN